MPPRRSTASARSSTASAAPKAPATRRISSRISAAKTPVAAFAVVAPTARRSQANRRDDEDDDDDDDEDDDDELESLASYATRSSIPPGSAASMSPENTLQYRHSNTSTLQFPSPSTDMRQSLHQLTLRSAEKPASNIENSMLMSSPSLGRKKASRANSNTPRVVRKEPFADISPSKQNLTVVSLDPVAQKELVKTTVGEVEIAPDTPKPAVLTMSEDAEIVEPQGPVKRLTISNLVLNDFKSYAGRQEIGPFHSSFSAVVGPNGSGKSNVIDSLLFVFGFRANKMRQSKISALIHNSAAHPDCISCSVEVHFQDVIDNPDGTTTVVPDSKLVVARRAFKNNSSKYTINDCDSNFNEVTTLLRERGIDLDHKRFLILQGEVESIALMKPKAQNENDDGLLEYLEDIIGTTKYKKLIEESSQEVDALNELCHEKNERLEIVRKEKNHLEDARTAALAYIRNFNDLALKKSALYQIYITTSKQNIEITKEVVTEFTAELEKELATNQGNQDEIEALNATYIAAAKDLEAYQTQFRAANKTQAKHERDVVQLTEKKKHIDAKKDKLIKTMAASKLSESSSASWMSKFDEEIVKLNREIQKFESSMATEETKLEEIKESLEGKTKGISEEIEVKKKALEPWNEKINKKKSELEVAKSELKIFVDKFEAGRQAISEAEEKVSGIKNDGRAKEQELETLRAELSHIEEQIRLGEVDCRNATAVLENSREELAILRQKTQEARTQFNSSKSQSHVLKSLMHLEETGRVSGFHGRLGNLGVIDEQFDIAISTACPSLNNLVVENVETGQECINYLRKNNLGRANFILLDKLPPRNLSAIQTPENVPRLFDLVRPKEEKFAPAFYSVLQDTLVAKDLAQANRIAFGGKKRWRVVTLDGKLIDMSGTMSGGGTRVVKGLMKSVVSDGISESALKKIEDQCAQREGAFEQEQARVNTMVDALKDLKKRKPKVDVMVSKVELEIQALGATLIDARKMLKELEAEVRSSSSNEKSTVNELEKKIATIEVGLEQLRGRTAKIEEEISELEERIMEIGGVQLRIQKSKVDGIKQQIEIRGEQISHAEMSKVKAEKEAAKQSKAAVSAQKELDEIDAEAAGVQRDLEDAAAAARELEKATSKATFELEERQDQLKEIKGQLDDRTKEINKFRKVEMELRNKIETHEKEIRENQKRLRHWTEKLAALTLHNSTGEEEEDAVQFVVLSEDELDAMDQDELKAEIVELEENTGKAHVDLTVLEEYSRREKEFATRDADLKSVIERRDSVKARYEDLRRRRLDEFMAGFSQISLKLKEMYQMITMGGNAELELVDSLDPFSEGILFSVMPPKKSWKNISNVSGGEKTLSSLALVFALHHFKPTPLYVMDEIDAALDFRNVSIVANYIKERTKNAQFIVISLRNNMFELAKQLVGIYKVNHMTKSITIQNRELQEVISGQGSS
ncbi:RecF/RecN/SMC [Limtongia smithiae]|uniref:RecF/RecN/SMC n=1 Tax=Limtongia smithiae TaxID=1125753 RepID=UPI0034D016D2